MISRKSNGSDTDQQQQTLQLLSQPAHYSSAEQVVQELRANASDGLATQDAQQRFEHYGSNDLGEEAGVQPIKILLAQVANAMTLVLVLAMAVSFGIQSWIEGGVITFVIALNVVIGFRQEFYAQKTMVSLRSLSSPTANVVRDGQNITIPTREVVPGDMVELKTGDTIPADMRLLEAVNFETDEALLTGESMPVSKVSDMTFDKDTGPGDRLNVAYSSSTVTKGRAKGIVFATGMATEIGSIATALRAKDSKRRRSVKREPDGSAPPHRYAHAFLLTVGDAIGAFLGIRVGTPLQKKLARLALLLFGVAVICAIIVLAANNFARFPSVEGSNPTQEVAIYAVATGLSMIPASLTVILTITMAAGAKRMVKRNVIVRRMDALEALGSVTDICSDKTGTLTQGRMVAKKAWVPAKGMYNLGDVSDAFNPSIGAITHEAMSLRRQVTQSGEAIPEQKASCKDLLHDNTHLEEFLKVASLANLAEVHQTGDEWKVRGNPTEVAMQVFSSRFGWNRTVKVGGEKPAYHQLAEFPFDSVVKRMSVVSREASTGKVQVLTKGAVEKVIEMCSKIYVDEHQDAMPLTSDISARILQNMESFTALGLRCLALASRQYDSDSAEFTENMRHDIEQNLTFRGLIGLYDPPRPESAGAVKECHQAGISVHMLTGDHPGTARTIASQVGILPSRMDLVAKDVAAAMVMTAGQFDKLSPDEIDALPVLPLVIARCTPNTKVRMIEALHRRDRFVAMTGDGVNDSPSLKKADVGIAMGASGSDVAKDASDIVLTDDNFASIVNAVEEGRRMFDNIQKFVLHLLAQNIAQACVLLIGLAFKDTRNLSVFPLSPVEILWMIMITSGIPDMGLGFEHAAPDIMRRPPVNLKAGIFTAELLIDMVVYGVWIAALCLGSFALVLWGFGDGNLGSGCNAGHPLDCDTVLSARGTAFATLTWCSLFLAWEMLSMRRSLFSMRPGSTQPVRDFFTHLWRNKFLFWAVIAGFFLCFPILYVPVINTDVFVHTGIDYEWGIVFVATILFFVGVEAWKWGKRVYFRGSGRRDGRNGSVVGGDVEGRIFRDFIGRVDSGSSSEDGSLEGEKR